MVAVKASIQLMPQCKLCLVSGYDINGKSLQLQLLSLSWNNVSYYIFERETTPIASESIITEKLVPRR